MLRLWLLNLVWLGLVNLAFSQKSPIVLTFMGTQLNQHTSLDSIVIRNVSKARDTILYWPDTVLNLLAAGIKERNPVGSDFQLFQNFPNPFDDQTVVRTYVPAQGKLEILASDILGRTIVLFSANVSNGLHSFVFYPGDQRLYYISAIWKGERKSIKAITSGNLHTSVCRISVLGSAVSQNQYPRMAQSDEFLYSVGDLLRIIAYKDSLNAVTKTILKESRTCQLSFGLFPPCPGVPEVHYADQEYLTVKIGTQCWLKENLNVGIQVNSINTGLPHTECADNGIIEKYCYDNDPKNCDLFGGLYDWNEIMKYQTIQGIQGICPPEFHVPTDDDLAVLVNFFDGEWVAGGKLKEEGIMHWLTPNYKGSNESGFTALASGFRTVNGEFSSLAYYEYFWSSTLHGSGNAFYRYLYYNNEAIYQSHDPKNFGYSVRCVKD